MASGGRRFGFLALTSEKRNLPWVPEDTLWLQAVANTFISGELSIRSQQE